jgi:hypothetical protein
MPVSWQEDFLQKLVDASQHDARLAATLRPRKLRVGFEHPLMRSVECRFDGDRLAGSGIRQMFVVECVPKRGSVVDEPALRTEIEQAGLTGEFGVDGGRVLFQYQWGVDPRAGFPVHNPQEVRRLVDWTLGVLRLLFDHVERRHRVLTPGRAAGAGDAGGTNYAAAMEQYLEDFIVQQWNTLPWAGTLVYLDRQVVCGDIGELDILARDRAGGDFVVIELKKDKPERQVVGQLSSYMGWIKQQRAIPLGVAVRGIIVALNETPKLRAAVSAHENIELYTYRFKVDLQKATGGAVRTLR